MQYEPLTQGRKSTRYLTVIDCYQKSQDQNDNLKKKTSNSRVRENKFPLENSEDLTDRLCVIEQEERASDGGYKLGDENFAMFDKVIQAFYITSIQHENNLFNCILKVVWKLSEEHEKIRSILNCDKNTTLKRWTKFLMLMLQFF